MQVLGVDLDERDIGLLVGTYNGGVELAVVVEGDLKLLGAVDHVVVGHDVAVRADDHARA